MRSLAIILACTATPAFADGADIGAVVNGGRMETWAADHTLGAYLNPERVFGGEFALIAGGVVGDEPGYFFRPSSEFAGQAVGFNIRRALRVWDPLAPSGATNFQSVPTSTITFGDAVLGQVTTPAADPASPIMGLQVVIPAGGVDFHYPLTLNTPAAGIYLVELEKRTSLSGVLNSEPYWLVLNYGLDEPEHERAIEYVRDTIVPAPATAMLALFGAVFAGRRRR